MAKKDSKKVVASKLATSKLKKVKLPSVNLSFLKPLAKILAPITKYLSPLGRYLKGSWEELGQVRWPNRRMTWELTIAVLGFSAFFVLFILLLDALFKYLFSLVF